MHTHVYTYICILLYAYVYVLVYVYIYIYIDVCVCASKATRIFHQQAGAPKSHMTRAKTHKHAMAAYTRIQYLVAPYCLN